MSNTSTWAVFLLWIAVVANADIVSLFDDSNYGGANLDLDVRQCTNLASEWNDKVSSIRTNGKCFILYQHSHCAGKSFRASQDTAYVGNEFNDQATSVNLCTPLPPPPTWQEHWAEHNQVITKVYSDADVAIYFDKDVNPSITWPNTFVRDVWRYVKRVYGNFGQENNLYAIFHAGKYSGGHPDTYFGEGHDYRNVIDCGDNDPNAFLRPEGWGIACIVHETAHVVEGAAKGIKGSPQFGIWHDSKWAEIFGYDVHLGLGRTADANRIYNELQTNKDNFPRENSYWFRDWFYPIYNKYGRSQVLNNYFNLLSQNFPKNWIGNEYGRDMNWGEFVHFWSGAAGKNLKPLATSAFGWPQDWENQFNNARTEFPRIQYPN